MIYTNINHRSTRAEKFQEWIESIHELWKRNLLYTQYVYLCLKQSSEEYNVIKCDYVLKEFPVFFCLAVCGFILTVWVFGIQHALVQQSNSLGFSRQKTLMFFLSGYNFHSRDIVLCTWKCKLEQTNVPALTWYYKYCVFRLHKATLKDTQHSQASEEIPVQLQGKSFWQVYWGTWMWAQGFLRTAYYKIVRERGWTLWRRVWSQEKPGPSEIRTEPCYGGEYFSTSYQDNSFYLSHSFTCGLNPFRRCTHSTSSWWHQSQSLG